MLYALPLDTRHALAVEALVLVEERKQAKHGSGATDSDVLEVIDAWVMPCGHADDTPCSDHRIKCDREVLYAMVWDTVETANAAEAEEQA